MQDWIAYVRGLSKQCVLPLDQTRSIEYRLETTNDQNWRQHCTNQQQKVSRQIVIFLISLTRNKG